MQRANNVLPVWLGGERFNVPLNSGACPFLKHFCIWKFDLETDHHSHPPLPSFNRHLHHHNFSQPMGLTSTTLLYQLYVKSYFILLVTFTFYMFTLYVVPFMSYSCSFYSYLSYSMGNAIVVLVCKIKGSYPTVSITNNYHHV